jgi:polysaccharide export outer membrane protein
MPFSCVFEMSVGMKKIGFPLFFPIIALFFSLSIQAQQPSPANPSAIASLQAFEGTGDGEYRLGCGDQISIMVVGHAEATGKQIVGPDGIVTLPYVGGVKVSNLTRGEAAKAITQALTPYYVNPSVVVGVDVYSSNNILVFGAVAHPGLMQLDGPATLLSVMSRAGMAESAGGAIIGKPTGVPERVAVFRGKQTILWTDFKQLLESASPDLLTPLQKNDVVYVPSPHQRYVSVFGEVLHPGLVDLQNPGRMVDPKNSSPVDLQDGPRLVQILAEAGGIVTDRAGRYPKIQIIHEFTGSIQTVDYQDILQSKKIELKLESGDIIYVPQSKFERVAVTFTKISPLISIATIATLVEHP